MFYCEMQRGGETDGDAESRVDSQGGKKARCCDRRRNMVRKEIKEVLFHEDFCYLPAEDAEVKHKLRSHEY